MASKLKFQDFTKHCTLEKSNGSLRHDLKVLTAYHRQEKSSQIEILERLKLLPTVVPQIKVQDLIVTQWSFTLVLGILIRPDIMGALNHFHQHCHVVKSSNGLIPKKKGAQYFGDFRPISLGNVYKVLAKTSAEAKICDLEAVSGEQSAFVKNRQITEASLLANQMIEGGLKMRINGRKT